MDAFWIICTGALAGVACSLLGCYLVLRKMTMLGDAISHSVLPGIVLAYLFSGGRDTLPMLLGAGTLGLLTTFIIEFFHREAKVQADAAIGITFTALFALGVVLVALFADQVDLDQDCVLYGEIAYVPLDVWIMPDGGELGPRAVWVLGAVLLLVAVFIGLFYKELYLTSFDPAFAAVIGISTALWHYALMGMVSLATVAAFESVGAILVVALLVGPAATAFLLTRQFKTMMLLAVGLAVLTAVAGYYLAAWLDASIAGAMSTCIGLWFVLALLFSPQGGLLWKKRSPQTA